jgi:hypothetical protein
MFGTGDDVSLGPDSPAYPGAPCWDDDELVKAVMSKIKMPASLIEAADGEQMAKMKKMLGEDPKMQKVMLQVLHQLPHPLAPSLTR